MTLTAKNRKIQQKISDFMVRNRVAEGSHLLVAFSGGPDSSALLDLLVSLRPAWGFKISCCYINHRLREAVELKLEIKAIKKKVEKYGCALHLRKVLKPGAQTKQKLPGGVEAWARQARYAALKAVKDQLDADYLVLGHNKDDCLETVVMRFFQGSGPPGLSGISEKSAQLLRPLSGLNRRTIMAYLEDNRLDYCVDSSNLKPLYLRNRVRNELIPLISKLFPGYQRAMHSFAEKNALYWQWMQAELAQNPVFERSQDGSFLISTERFYQIPAAMLMESIYLAFNTFYPSEDLVTRRLPYRFLRTVLPNRQRAGPANQILLAGYGICLKKAGKLVFLTRDIVSTSKMGYLITIKKRDVERFIPIGFSVRMSSVDGPADRRISSNGVLVDDDGTETEFIVRSRKSGDRIEQEFGTKSLKKLYNDWKVPVWDRWKIPLIEHEQRIIAVMGGIFGYKNAFAVSINLINRDNFDKFRHEKKFLLMEFRKSGR